MLGKLDKYGRIYIPKEIREKYNFTDEVTVCIRDYNVELRIEPKCKCYRCGIAIPDRLEQRGLCDECERNKRIVLHLQDSYS